MKVSALAVCALLTLAAAPAWCHAERASTSSQPADSLTADEQTRSEFVRLLQAGSTTTGGVTAAGQQTTVTDPGATGGAGGKVADAGAGVTPAATTTTPTTTATTPATTATAGATQAAAGTQAAQAGTQAAGGTQAAATVTPATTSTGAATQQATAVTATGNNEKTTSSKAKKPVIVNKVIEIAPEANVENGDDIDPEGKCAAEVEAHCKDVEVGDGKLAECLTDAVTQAENPEADANSPHVSDDCREDIMQYRIYRNSNINKNLPLAKACKNDVVKVCNQTWPFAYKSGQVIKCLRENKDQLSKECKKQVEKSQLDAAMDMRADPVLWEACKDDKETLCKDVSFGGGRVQACLREQRMKLSFYCEDQLFRQEAENADDIRLSVRLFVKCMPDKRKFCKDIAPGSSRVKDCLEEHREELSGPCREEVDGMLERRVKDFRLDSKLRKACEAEIFQMCNFFGDLDDIDTYDVNVINCLQDYNSEITNGECKRQVKKYMVLAASDVRFDVPLAEACFDDRTKYCKNVPPGSARVIRCLSNQRSKLSTVCRATLFDEEVRFSENIDFQHPMKEACSAELNKFCKDVPHGNARAIRCLQDNKDEKDFGKACRAEINAYEAEISKDFRLNFRLNKNCATDVLKLCPAICPKDGNVCGGKVLRCLTDKADQIESQDCRKEVDYYQRMEVENFNNDVILAEACREDVDKFCANVEPGEGRVHQCLRDKRKQLSDQCRAEELLLEEKEASSIEMSKGLLRACKAERQMFCREVRPGAARVFRCLAENMNDADFSAGCKNLVLAKLQRRQSNWKLDPPLRKACKSDVASLCSAEDSKNSEQGLVYKCLINNVAQISQGCQRELGRAVHMAFYVWQEGATLTAECDQDIKDYCLKARPNMKDRPGAVGTCLASILERQERTAGTRRSLAGEAGAAASAGSSSSSGLNPGALAGAKLSDKCYILADIAEPPNMKQAFDASLSYAALTTQLDKLGSVTGVPLVTRDPRGNPKGISLTGWVATLGMTAFVGLLVYGAYAVYRRMRGLPDKDYQLVLKGGGRR